jgi:hypothetical protein
MQRHQPLVLPYTHPLNLWLPAWTARPPAHLCCCLQSPMLGLWCQQPMPHPLWGLWHHLPTPLQALALHLWHHLQIPALGLLHLRPTQYLLQLQTLLMWWKPFRVHLTLLEVSSVDEPMETWSTWVICRILIMELSCRHWALWRAMFWFLTAVTLIPNLS